jgi:hypothetical protein
MIEAAAFLRWRRSVSIQAKSAPALIAAPGRPWAQSSLRAKRKRRPHRCGRRGEGLPGSILRLDLYDRGAVIAAGPERHRGRCVVHD